MRIQQLFSSSSSGHVANAPVLRLGPSRHSLVSRLHQGAQTAGRHPRGGRVGDPEESPAGSVREDRLHVRHHGPEGSAEEDEEDPQRGEEERR